LIFNLSFSFIVYNNNDFANLQMLLQEREAEYANLSAEMGSLQAEKEEMTQQLAKADGELFQLRTRCRDVEYNLNTKEEAIRELQLRLTSQPTETPAAQEADVPAPVKVSSLGAAKKSRSKGGKGGRAANESKTSVVDETPSAAISESQIAALNTKITSLENEIASLNQQTARLAVLEGQIATLEEQLGVSEQEKRTLQKRVDLLLSELDTTENNGIYFIRRFAVIHEFYIFNF
jgi:potassium efflux system protein